MLPFLLKRLSSAIVTLALATGVVFIAIHLLPGDPVAIMLGDQAGSDPVAVQRVRAQLGLDLPLGTQFAHWAAALAHGDLGVSLRTGEPVVDELAPRAHDTVLTKWRYSAFQRSDLREQLRNLVLVGLFAALGIVFQAFSISMPLMRIGIGPIPTIVSGMLLGPVLGGITGLLSKSERIGIWDGKRH